MASTWSALKIELLETGANSGTWGTLTNVNLGDAVLGEAITGSATVDFPTDADVTVTLTDSATTQSARNLRLNITESSTGVGSVRSLILGSGCQIEKFYLINNTGTGAKTVKNTTGTGISVPAGKATLVYNNGTNVVDAASYFSALTLGAALPVASGGTGITSFGTGVATWLGTPSSANLAAAVTDETGSGALVFATSPTFTTSVIGGATMAVFNTTSTTVNAFGAATTLNVGAATGTLTVANTTLAAKAITASTTLGVTGNATISGGQIIQNAATNNYHYYTDSLHINKNGGGGGDIDLSSGLVAVTGALSSTLGANIGGILKAVAGNSNTTANITTYGVSVSFDNNTEVGWIQSIAGSAAYRTLQLNPLGGAVTVGAGLAGGTSTGYSFSGSAPANSLTLDSSGNTLLGYATALANGKLQVSGSIGLSGNTEIRQATNSDGNTLRLLATQVVTGGTNATSYGYSGGGLLASVSSSGNAILLDVGGTTAGHRLKVANDGSGSSGNLTYSEAGATRFNVNSVTGDTTVSIGNVVIGTAGKGIDFSATTSGSGTMTSELLADYEEGTWTPAQGSGLTVVGTFSSSGRYTKIGRSVSISGRLSASTSLTTSAGTIMITGLPFSVAELTAVGVFTNSAINALGGIGAFGTLAYATTSLSAADFDFSLTYSV